MNQAAVSHGSLPRARMQSPLKLVRWWCSPVRRKASAGPWHSELSNRGLYLAAAAAQPATPGVELADECAARGSVVAIA